MKRWRSGAALALTLFGIWGCGGGGGNGGGGNPTERYAKPKVSIAWGPRSKAVNAPSSALSAVIVFDDASRTGADVSFSVDRSGPVEGSTVEYTGTEEIEVTATPMTVRFFAQAGGAGELVGVAAATVPVAQDGTVSTTVQTEGVVKTVEVPANQTVVVGEKRALDFGVKDEGGDLVAVTPGSATWAVASGPTKLTFEGDEATGLAVGTATVTATVDGKTSEPAPVKVTNPGAITVSISPTAISLAPSATQRFTVEVEGTEDERVTWSVVEENGGTVSNEGLYTAPAAVGTYTVKATSVDNPEKSDTATVIVRVPTNPGFTTIGKFGAAEGDLRAIHRITALSADGSTVVGSMSNPRKAAYWTEASGWVELETDAEHTSSEVAAVDATGTYMTGYGYQPSNSGYSYRWNRNGTFTRLFARATSGSMEAKAITDDGQTVFGVDRSTDFSILRWTEATGSVKFAPKFNLYSVSANGQILAGGAHLNPSEHRQSPVLWTQAAGFEALGDTGDTLYLSASGDRALGYTFLWDRATGNISLDGTPTTMSRNGKYVIYFKDDLPYIWSAEKGGVPLAPLLEAAGAPAGLDYSGFFSPQLISSDGLTVTGSYRKAPGQPVYAYYCRLAEAP